MIRAVGLGALALAAGARPACGSADTASTATTTPAATTAAQIADGPDPGTVAVRYTQALFAGHFDRARRYVAPDSRNALLVIVAGLRNASLSHDDLAAGSSRVDGASAVSTLTGTLCSSHSAKPVTQSPRDCITNSDPRSDNPVFRVAMELGPDRRWQVAYRAAPAAGAENPTP